MNAAWKSAASSTASGASSRIGVRSPPPPNQPFVVTSIRVLKCAAGTRGLRMCATRLMPQAQKRGSCSAPGICARNSGLNSPQTVETFTPTFSNTPPAHHAHHAAAAVRAVLGRARPRGADEPRRPARSPSGAVVLRPRSPRTRRRAGRAAPRTRRGRRPAARHAAAGQARSFSGDLSGLRGLFHAAGRGSPSAAACCGGESALLVSATLLADRCGSRGPCRAWARPAPGGCQGCTASPRPSAARQAGQGDLREDG